METILVVEDEPDIRELIAYNLELSGYNVLKYPDGEKGLDAVRKEKPDLVLLDLMLPGIDGVTVCKKIKRDPKIKNIPVIMLTARTTDDDMIEGLEVGADDYVTKPFNPRVLLARIKIALRKGSAGEGSGNEGKVPDKILLEHIEISLRRHEVLVEGNPVLLSATEFGILSFLASNVGIVFSRDRIIDAVKGDDYPVTGRAVDVQILGIRRKLGEWSSLVETVRGVGYRLNDELRSED